MELEEDLLGDVLGRRSVGEYPVGDRHHLGILLQEQPLERIRHALVNRAQRPPGYGRAPRLHLEHLPEKHRRPRECDRRRVAAGLNRIYKVSAPGAEPGLLALPGRLAILAEGGESLFGVGRLEETEDAAPLERQRTLQRHFEALLRDQLDLADGDRRDRKSV